MSNASKKIIKFNKHSIEDVLYQPIKINKTFWVVLLLVCSFSAGAFSFYKAVRKVGKPFQGFFIGANLMVSVGQRSSWSGIEAGLKPLDKILKVNGRGVSTIDDFHNAVDNLKVNDLANYSIERGGEKKSVWVSVRKMSAVDFLVSFLAPFSIGLIFLIVGALTTFYVPDQRISYVYFVLCSLIGVFCLVVYESYTSHTFFRFTQIYPMIAAVSVHLFAIFPESKKISDTRTFIVAVVYLVAAALVGSREYFLYNQDVSIILSKTSSFFVAFALMINLFLLIDSLLAAETNLARDKVKVLIAGLIIASSAVGLWSTNFIFKRAMFYLDEAILLSLIFPIFMSYAILKKNIFDIDHVLRLSLTYAFSSGVVLLVYVVIVAMIGFLWPELLETRTILGFLAILGIIGAFIFNPLKKNMRVLVYKLFFREKYNRLQTLMEYGKKLSLSTTIDEISNLLVSDLVDLMGLKGAFLIAYTGHITDAPVLQMAKGIDHSRLNLGSFDKKESYLIRLAANYDKPQLINDLKVNKTAEAVDRLRDIGVKIAAPIKSKGELLGLLFLSEKISMDIFTVEDLEFLEALSNQAAVSLENAKLYIEKSRQERLAAIGQVASVIIHEIKNPLGVIKVSSGTIKRKFKADEKGYELATFIEQEVDRMNSTIQQILYFAKPRENKLEDFNLDGMIADTVKSFGNDLPERRIKLTCELNTGDENIWADSEKLRRAVINLITNAKQAVPDGSEIFVKTRIVSFEGRENLEIEVEDTGEGIGENDMKYIFQPFYTTRQEGTGLGLAIVKQIASDHSGAVEVKSSKGRGTKFIVRIPKRNISKNIGEGQWKNHADKGL